MAREHTYRVTGTGQFPEDMLRYDRAHYATDEDRALAEHGVDGRKRRRTISLIGLERPTLGRWESFTWKVELN